MADIPPVGEQLRNLAWSLMGEVAAVSAACRLGAQEVERLTAENDVLRPPASNYNRMLARAEAAEAKVGLLRQRLLDVALSGVEHDDPRNGYVLVQINRQTWDYISAQFGTSVTAAAQKREMKG